MLVLIKEIIMDLNKDKLTQQDVSRLVPLLEALLQMNGYNIDEFNAIQLMLLYLEEFDEQLKQNRVLGNAVRELKLRIMRFGLNHIEVICKGTGIKDNSNAKVVYNVQLYSPLKEGHQKKVEDYKLLDNGEIEKEVLFDIHPNINIESEFPIFNDYAQVAFNKADGLANN